MRRVHDTQRRASRRPAAGDREASASPPTPGPGGDAGGPSARPVRDGRGPRGGPGGRRPPLDRRPAAGAGARRRPPGHAGGLRPRPGRRPAGPPRRADLHGDALPVRAARPAKRRVPGPDGGAECLRDHVAAPHAPAVTDLTVPASGGAGARGERPGIRAAEVTVIPPGRATDAEPLSVFAVPATGTGPRRTAANPRTGRSRPRNVRRRGRPTPCSPPPCRTGTAGAGRWRPGSGRRVRDAERGRRVRRRR